MPVIHLRKEGFEVTAFFFNPNIHPQEEYNLRRLAMAQAAAKLELPVMWAPAYDTPDPVQPKEWVCNLPDYREGARCKTCYQTRLNLTAKMAADHDFSGFCTSLLYSRYQRHDDIIAAGLAACRSGSSFIYRDFRPYWQQGIALSKEFGLYRQKWCGCALSRAEAKIMRLKKQRHQVQVQTWQPI